MEGIPGQVTKIEKRPGVINYLGMSRRKEKQKFGEFEEKAKPGHESGVDSYLILSSKSFVEKDLSFIISAAICKMNGISEDLNSRPHYKLDQVLRQKVNDILLQMAVTEMESKSKDLNIHAANVSTQILKNCINTTCERY